MKHKRLLICISAIVLEFLIFLIWGLNLNGGDEMGFGLITSYFMFPLTTLILSAFLANENVIYVIPFTVISFAAQNFMPFFVFGSFEIVLILCFTLIPVFIGTLAGLGIKKLKK